MFSPSRGTSFASFPFSRSLLIICSVHFLLLTPESQFPSPHTQSCQSFSNALLVVMPEFASNLFTIFQVFETHQNEVLLPRKSHGWRSLVSCSPWGRQESDTTEWLHFTFHFHALENEMATHSSVRAWRIPGTGEPGGLPSMELHRVRHDWSDLAAAAAAEWSKVSLLH